MASYTAWRLLVGWMRSDLLVLPSSKARTACRRILNQNTPSPESHRPQCRCCGQDRWVRSSALACITEEINLRCILSLRHLYRKSLHISGHDLVDGTPVLDIKPYVPNDAVSGAQCPEWVNYEQLRKPADVAFESRLASSLCI